MIGPGHIIANRLRSITTKKNRPSMSDFFCPFISMIERKFEMLSSDPIGNGWHFIHMR